MNHDIVGHKHHLQEMLQRLVQSQNIRSTFTFKSLGFPAAGNVLAVKQLVEIGVAVSLGKAPK